MRRPPVSLLLALSLVLPAAAQAAPALEVHVARPSVGFGHAHEVTGTLLDGATPLAGQPIVLEGRRYPFEGSFRVIARTATDPTGAFAFKPVLDRDHQVRVVAPNQQSTSQVVRVYTLPSFELSYRAIEPGVVRMYQRYTVPNAVRLTAPTFFYLGPRGATRASKRVTARTRRTSPGHFSSRATVRLPLAWHGRFRYGSCFRTSPGSGMGDPKATCPKRRLRFK